MNYYNIKVQKSVKFYLLFLVLIVGLVSAKTISEETHKTIQSIRSEIPKDLQRQLPNGSQDLVGRCGFVYLNSEHDSQLDRMVSASLDIKIPVAFHVIYATNYDEWGNPWKEGYVDEYRINEQINILNQAYEGYGIDFFLYSTDYTDNSDWFDSDNDFESDYKQALALDPAYFLNIYTATAGEYLGYSYLPSATLTFDKAPLTIIIKSLFKWFIQKIRKIIRIIVMKIK